MLDILFKFPILMLDGNMEQKKSKKADLYGDDTVDDLDIIEGEAEVPYIDFLSIQDRWIPNPESWEKARNGQFEACFVTFSGSGSFIVPWTKDKFKKELRKFVDKVTSKNTKYEAIDISGDDIKELFTKKRADKKSSEKDNKEEKE